MKKGDRHHTKIQEKNHGGHGGHGGRERIVHGFHGLHGLGGVCGLRSSKSVKSVDSSSVFSVRWIPLILVHMVTGTIYGFICRRSEIYNRQLRAD